MRAKSETALNHADKLFSTKSDLTRYYTLLAEMNASRVEIKPTIHKSALAVSFHSPIYLRPKDLEPFSPRTYETEGELLNDVLENIGKHTLFEKVTLSNITFNAENIIHICTLIKNNMGIKHFTINHSIITDIAADTFMKRILSAFGRDHRLESLNIASNGLTFECGIFLCDFLKNNPSLKEIDIRGNKIGNLGMSYIEQSIGKNITKILFDVQNIEKNRIHRIQDRCIRNEYPEQSHQENSYVENLIEQRLLENNASKAPILRRTS